MVDKPPGNPTNSDVIECGLEKDRLGADGVAKGGNRPVELAYTGRRVSSLVPWGDPRGGLRLWKSHKACKQT